MATAQQPSLHKKQFRTPEEKRRHYEAWKSSGLSRSAYCKQAHLAPSVFCKWVRDFEDKPPMSFVQIPVDANPRHAPPPGIEIKFINGLQCRFTHVQDVKLLVQWVEALQHVTGHQ